MLIINFFGEYCCLCFNFSFSFCVTVISLLHFASVFLTHLISLFCTFCIGQTINVADTVCLRALQAVLYRTFLQLTAVGCYKVPLATTDMLVYSYSFAIMNVLCVLSEFTAEI